MIKIHGHKPALAFLILLIVFSFSFCKKTENISTDKEISSTQEAEPIVVSLLGKKLYAPAVSETAQKNYDEAKKNFETDPNEENTIWLGRRTAYLSQYLKAIEIFTEGIERFPESYKLYRHRGHRHISLRQFEKAVTDFTKAAELVDGKPLEVEPDGMPNKLNIPVSNTQFNIWYHLGLAYYLLGQHENAVSAYQECLKWCNNDDSLTACADWLYMSYRRMENIEEAVEVLDLIREDMEIIENQAYHNRLLMYKGLKTPESLLTPGGETEYDRNLAIATQGYGVATWFYYNGEKEKAKEIANQILEGKSWAAFGYIAAEVDQARNYFEDSLE